MGLLDRFKSQRDIVKEEIKEVQWVALEKEEQLEELTEISKAVPVLIFKHSTTCGISRMALRQFEQDYDIDEKQLEPFFLDLKRYRDISQAIAEKFQVRHESPQVILIKNRAAVYDDSHGSINVARIKEKL
tara:strand:- start:42322 stop:42714 length:393 start_codon:yes stop_codon:yes gene_type:complete